VKVSSGITNWMATGWTKEVDVCCGRWAVAGVPVEVTGSQKSDHLAADFTKTGDLVDACL
jgi:hypothetical protein